MTFSIYLYSADKGTETNSGRENEMSGMNQRCDTGELIQEATQVIRNLALDEEESGGRCPTAELLEPVQLPPVNTQSTEPAEYLDNGS